MNSLSALRVSCLAAGLIASSSVLVSALPAQAQTTTQEVVIPYSIRNNFFSPAIVTALNKPWRAPSRSYQLRAIGSGEANVQANRAYFAFNLLNVKGKVKAATLRIKHSKNSYDSSDPSETVQFWSVDNWKVYQLENPPGLDEKTPSALETLGRMFKDLGEGTLYGSFVATADSNKTIEEIRLNQAAIDSINASTGSSLLWVTGAALSTATATQASKIERVFRGTDLSQNNNRLTELVLTVEAPPKPAPLLGGWLGASLLGLGLSGVGAGALRRRRRA